MKFVFNILFILALLSEAVHCFLNAQTKISPTRLRTVEDCAKFQKQSVYDVTRCDLYHKDEDKKFYLDANFKESIIECAQSMANMTTKRTAIVLYMPRNIEDFKNVTISNLEKHTQAYAMFAPEIYYFTGPGNLNETTIGGIEYLSTQGLIIRILEKEMRRTAYNQEFFDQMEHLSHFQNSLIYVELNGWHLRNMAVGPNLTNIETFIQGIIVWVERSNAHMIGKNEVERQLNDTHLLVIYDMPGSPDIVVGTGHRVEVLCWTFSAAVLLLLLEVF